MAKLLKTLGRLPTLYQLILLAVLGGSISALSKVALSGIPPLTFVFLRLLVVSLLLGVMNVSMNAKLTKEKFKLFLGISTFWWINLLIYAFGVQKTTAITAQFILVATPVLTAIFSTIFLKKV